MILGLPLWMPGKDNLIIEFGKLEFEMSKISIEACETHSDGLLIAIVGISYYHIGNYSAAQTCLKCALQLLINVDVKDEDQREGRLQSCFYILMSGDYFNVFCYGYIFAILISAITVKKIHEQYVIHTQQQPKQQPEAETVVLSTETGVTEEKHSFLWSQFNKCVHNLQCAIDKHVSRTEKFVSQFQFFSFYIRLSCIVCSPFLILCAVHICIIKFIRCLLLVCCTKQQIVYCCTLCKFLAIAFIATTFVFVLGLDWLY